jgi:CBS domain-containing protein
MDGNGMKHVRPDHPVEKVMMWPVATVPAEATLLEVAAALAADEIGAVLVIRGGHPIGIVSERDIVGHLSAGEASEHVTAGEVMAIDIVTISPGDSVLTAAVTMREAGVRHLPVLDHGRIAGIVSMRDMLDVLSRACENDADVIVVPSGTRVVVRTD